MVVRNEQPVLVDAYREFQEHQLGTRDEHYYALIASLLA